MCGYQANLGLMEIAQVSDFLKIAASQNRTGNLLISREMMIPSPLGESREHMISASQIVSSSGPFFVTCLKFWLKGKFECAGGS